MEHVESMNIITVLDEITAISDTLRREHERKRKIEIELFGTSAGNNGARVQESNMNRQELKLTYYADLMTRINEEERRRSELQRMLEPHLNELSHEEEDIMYYRYIKCLRWEDIADVTGYHIRSCYKIHHTARRKLGTIGQYDSVI